MDMNTEKMVVRTFLELVRAKSANNAAPAPAPKPDNIRDNSIEHSTSSGVSEMNSPTINLLPMIMYLEFAAKYMKLPAPNSKMELYK